MKLVLASLLAVSVLIPILPSNSSAQPKVLADAQPKVLFDTRPKVLAELFRNTNCGNCRQPDEEFEQYIRDHPEKGIVEIFYHNSITNAQDPFYLASKADVETRSNSFYKIISNPTALINGVNKAERSNKWIAGVEAAPPLATTVAVSTSLSGTNAYKIDIDVTGSSGESSRLFVAITESGINFNNDKLYGNPGDIPIWDNVFRKMLPTKDGGDPFTISGTQHFSYTLDLTGKTWDPNQLKAIVIVQPVQSAGSNNYPVTGLAVAPLIGAAVKDAGQVNTLFEAGSTRLLEPAHVRISDILGRQILNSEVNPEELSARLSSLPSGFYLLSADKGGAVEQRKLVR